ncbi:transposase [Actinomycetospora sp. TBRC 11914]|uniref:transposase n=1 Tax=Actinomycetospora sp. TBRC 11914 TaxID=2729387 RepID=UPI00145DD085|nr:transposase [Actinomycetospora sp. TBRC 11914]NMO94153.1 transposase [Actinomycetospora sp. TBRC 11914]
MLPPDVRDWLPEGHLAWVVIDAVETLDLAALISTYRLGGRGRRAYDPTMMLTLLIYAYCCGQSSSRQIERLCEHDVAFRVITGNQRPDHDTIAAFRAGHREVFKDLFTQVLTLCREAGLGRVGTIAVDGSKFAANASSRANRTAAGIDRALHTDTGGGVTGGSLTGGSVTGGGDGSGEREGSGQGEFDLGVLVEARLAAAENTDAGEDAEHGPGRRGDEPPEDLTDPGRRRARFAQAREKIRAREQAATAQAAARQARYEQATAAREAHRGEHGSYPPGRPPTEPTAPDQSQPLRVNTTDPDSRSLRTAQGFLQGFNAQAAVSDDQLLLAIEVVDQANDYGQLAAMTRAALANLTAAGITDPVETVLADAGYFHPGDLDTLHAAHRTHHGPEPLVPPNRDALRDPADQQPPRQQSPRAKAMRARLAEPDQRARYRRRSATVEPVFGQIKTRISNRFRLRGLEAVRAELALIATAHNLLKLHTARTTG